MDTSNLELFCMRWDTAPTVWIGLADMLIAADRETSK